jgi:hypothetical protein
MVTARHFIAALVCLLYVPDITTAFLRKSLQPKRHAKSSRALDLGESPASKLFFKGKEFQEETIAPRYGSIVLDCEASGTPSPTIHWLKNGVRIEQDFSHPLSDDETSFENDKSSEGKRTLKVSATHSRLYLDCLSDNDEATYTCVAESPLIRISQSTNLVLETPVDILYNDVYECNEKRSSRGEPARIYMWTVSRIELENNIVQLFCRATGNPQPNIVWLDTHGNPIENDDYYSLASNGDLVIRDITWLENMGQYTCVADNGFGNDKTHAFVYPTTLRRTRSSP